MYLLFTNQLREHLSGASPLTPGPADAEVRKLTKEGDICVSDILRAAFDDAALVAFNPPCSWWQTRGARRRNVSREAVMEFLARSIFRPAVLYCSRGCGGADDGSGRRGERRRRRGPARRRDERRGAGFVRAEELRRGGPSGMMRQL